MPKLVICRPDELRDGKLIIRVQLSPPAVYERWIYAADEPVRPRFGCMVLDFANQGVILSRPNQREDVVEYHLPQSSLDHYMDKQGLKRVSIRTEPRTYLCEVLTRLTQLILPSVEAPLMSSPFFLEHFAALLCAHVAHLHSDGVPESAQSRGGLSAWQKRLTLQILAKNGYENTKLSVLAMECQLSVSHFARSFKTTFGQPFHRWLVNQRVERSKELLLKSDSALVEIAFQAGFADQATFNRTFAKLVGTSPGRWRRTHKDKACIPLQSGSVTNSLVGRHLES
jgi:AraC family transcriptional regulator